MAVVGLLAPRQSSADVILIDDGKVPGGTRIPFTCSKQIDNPVWLPFMGFVYRNVERFELHPGDTIAFDIEMRATDPATLGFTPQLDIALAHSSDATNPFKPDDLPGSDFTVVANAALAASQGNKTPKDYDLVFTVDRPFSFPGGILLIRVGNPRGELANRDELQCLPVITADTQPDGTNRLVGTFKLDPEGEYPWLSQNSAMGADVPYVRIEWNRCGDSVTRSGEECDDGNLDDTDDCTNSCTTSRCGDGIVSQVEACDNSANPAEPDPFCSDSCEMTVFAKGSGCSTGGGAGIAGVLGALGLLWFGLRRRRGGAAAAAVLLAMSWAAPATAHAQVPMKTDGFRVDRFELAPSVEDGIVVQDPAVLRNMLWSVNATLGFTNTILRVTPSASSDTGIDVVGPRLSAYLDFAMGFAGRFEVNASLPFALTQSTEPGLAAGIMVNEASRTAVGDGRIGGSVLIYGKQTGPQAGLAGSLIVPVGSEDAFTGDGGVGAEVVATGGYARPEYRLIANAGVRIRPEADYITSNQGTEFIGRAGVIVPLLDKRLATSLEFDVLARSTKYDGVNAEYGAPILALLGARYHFASGIRAGAGIGMGLTEAPGSPAVRALLTIGYSPEPRIKPRRTMPPEPTGPDADKDHITDSLDRCPQIPEDYDGVEDTDGCPDPDFDTDKVVDTAHDPTKPLTLEMVITLPAPIEFYFDTAIMRPGAEVYLQQVYDVMKNHPEVLKMEVQGHTSNEGGPEYNQRLSNDRAKAVVKWLVDRGIDAKRLVPMGYGLQQPLAPNDAEGNRQRNRRVQFRLVDQEKGSAPVPGAPPSTLPQSPAAQPGTPAAKPGTPAAPATPAVKPATTTAPAAPATAPAAKPATTTAPAAPTTAPTAKPAAPTTPATAPAKPATPAPTAPAKPATPAPVAPATAPAKPATPAPTAPAKPAPPAPVAPATKP
jgi:uncharacterized protein (TIGR03382 family)